jgi:hypothetical protein
MSVLFLLAIIFPAHVVGKTSKIACKAKYTGIVTLKEDGTKLLVNVNTFTRGHVKNSTHKPKSKYEAGQPNANPAPQLGAAVSDSK